MRSCKKEEGAGGKERESQYWKGRMRRENEMLQKRRGCRRERERKPVLEG